MTIIYRRWWDRHPSPFPAAFPLGHYGIQERDGGENAALSYLLVSLRHPRQEGGSGLTGKSVTKFPNDAGIEIDPEKISWRIFPKEYYHLPDEGDVVSQTGEILTNYDLEMIAVC